MQIKTYTGKYIPLDIVQSCYIEKQSTFIDKTLTGNGFTYSSMSLKPKQNHVNIIIAPNKEVVKSKEIYRRNDWENRIGFFYKESTDVLIPELYDVMIFVSDSFIYYEDKIASFKDRIDKITVDEYHSVLIQSSFRILLSAFKKYIDTTYPNTTRVFVTATPMLFSKIDIVIKPIKLEKRTIKISQNEISAIEKIHELLRNKENVLVASQDLKIFKNLANENKLKANLKIGDTLMLKVAEVVEIENDTESNLTLISSRGFEGFDLPSDKKYHVFIFENRKHTHTSFFPQNIVQTIGRARGGTNEIYWIRIPVGSRYKIPALEKMEKVVASRKISNEKKVSDRKNYGFLHKYYNFNYDKNLGLISDFELKEDTYNLDVEFVECDTIGLRKYKQFFEDRGFSFDFLNDAQRELEDLKVRSTGAFKMLKLNKKIIEERELIKGLVFKFNPESSIEKIASNFRKYFRRKYYQAPNLVWKMKECEIDVLSYLNNTHRELKAYRIISDENALKSLYDTILKIQYEWKREELSKRDFEEWKKESGAISLITFIQLLIGFSQQKVQVQKKIVNNRDYNATTQTGIDVVCEIADFFGRIFYEIDIRTCNPRLIYAYCGLDLPKDFYGKNKENKVAINKLLNTISKEFAIEWKSDMKIRKYQLKTKMRSFGFDERVIDFLINTFFDKQKDAIFNFCSSYEKRLIDELIEILKQTSINNNSFVRRHDSILAFEILTDTQMELIRDFEFLDKTGWFIENENDVDIFTKEAKFLIEIDV